MALSVKTNQLTGPSGTGNSATTDPGFQPKGLFIWNGLQTSTGAVADAQFNLGVASSTTTERAGGYNSKDNNATSDVVRALSTDDLIRTLDAGATSAAITAALNSLDATGFTLNYATNGLSSHLFNYLALGGTDITNVMSGSFASNTSTGNQSVAGLGFTPDIVFFFVTLNTVSTAQNNNSQYGFGVMHSSGSQWAIGQRGQNAQATMNTSHSFNNNRCLTLLSTTTNTLVHEVSFVSMDSDGFTVNVDTAVGTAVLVGYMAIKGGQWKVGTSTQKTSTGTQSITGAGFTPSAAIFAGVCDTSTAGVGDHARLFWGSTTGASNNVCLWTGDQDAAADSIANTIMSNNKCIVMATEGTSATPTTNSEADLDSFDSDGVTLDWTTADATARVFGYVLLGADAVAPSAITYITSRPPWIS